MRVIQKSEQGALGLFFENSIFYVLGIAFLALAKAKNLAGGYSSSKSFDVKAPDRCTEYDLCVVEASWRMSQGYTSSLLSLAGKMSSYTGPDRIWLRCCICSTRDVKHIACAM